MRGSKAIGLMITALLAQSLVGSALVAAKAPAQAANLVAVISLYTGIDVCEVRYKKKNSAGNWETVGHPEACQGGLVTTEIMEAAASAASEAGAGDQAGRADSGSITDAAANVRLIPLSGDVEADEAAIETEVKALHESVTPPLPNEAASLDSGTFLGYMSAGALGESTVMQSAPPALPTCANGQIGQDKRADITWNHKKIGVTLKSYVYYERASCARWEIRRIETLVLATNYDKKIWMSLMRMTKFWFSNVSGFSNYTASLGCTRVYEGSWTTMTAASVGSGLAKWQIQGNSSIQLESIDTNPNQPSQLLSCKLEAGTSGTSLWTYLPGGTR